MFDSLQNRLQKIYEIETSHQVSNFITSNPSIWNSVDSGLSRNYETVFVCEEENLLNISVYLDSKVVEAFSKMHAIDLNTMCFAIEGISHFLYLIYNASYDRSVTLLEMELQAEVDKFIILLQNNDEYCGNKNSIKLHHELFKNINFRDSLTEIEKQRYEDANFYAGKLCYGLIKRHQENPNWQSMNRELRRFYRLPLQQKLIHINKLH